MSAERERQGGRNRRQERALARRRTEQVRQGLEDLALPDDRPVLSGTSPLLRQGRPRHRRSRPSLLGRLLGSRPPIVPLHLVQEGGRIEARIRIRPGSVPAGEALKELAALLEQVFRLGRPRFTDAEWRRLLGQEPASLGERLVLLARLAIPAATEIRTPELAFSPDDRGLKQYHAKFAALPDGLPFSLRLLLADRRGRHPKSAPSRTADDEFLTLPDAVLLLAVRATLAAEESEGQVRSDYEIGPHLRRALQHLGVTLPNAPSEGAVRRLRERWKRRGLHLFPKAADRARARARADQDNPASSGGTSQ